MVRLPSSTFAALLAALALPAAAPLQAQGDVTIYRCVDVAGQVSIGNLPCGDGQRQQTRSMVRPVDGEPAAPADARTDSVPAPTQEIRYVVSTPPQPLYECVRPDGSTYESDSGDGEPRWVPLWTSGWPVGGYRHGGGGRGGPGHGGGGRPGGPASGHSDLGSRGATTPAGSGLSAPPVSRISIPADPPRPGGETGRPPRPRPPDGGYGWPGEAGTWERDRCHALPQAETCGRLRDRRDDIRTRFFNAQQRERDTLRVEERGINARIDRDCRT